VPVWLCIEGKALFRSRQAPALRGEVPQHSSHCCQRMNKKRIHSVVPKEEIDDQKTAVDGG